ncbi:DNA cytosine methyltransferase, partial [Streptomyces sp. NPDC054796]
MSLTFTDMYAGAGGSSTGLVNAGLELKLAANHWQVAVDTHTANHPEAEHLCAEMEYYDMRRLPKTDILWASPICTEISPAGGRPRTKGQVDDEQWKALPEKAFQRTRATAFEVIRAVMIHRYKAVLVENVIEFATDWELFDWWLAGMSQLGYDYQIVCVSSAHIGDAFNLPAPQWRDRLYIVFTRTGMRLPDVKPKPLAFCEACDQDVHAVQT